MGRRQTFSPIFHAFTVLTYDKCNLNSSNIYISGAGNYLIIKATDATNLKTVTEVKIINLKGTVLDTIPMKEIPLEKGVFGGGPRIPPDEYFKLEVNFNNNKIKK